jgi:cyclophilin family peptidyl-prolyl cis-trans isomerase/HEAT repeat protein
VKVAVPFVLPARLAALGALVASALGSACATVPPAPPAPVVTFDQKMAWILRLEDERRLRDPEPPPPPPLTGRRVALPPAPSADLLRLLTDEEARVRRRAALAVGRVGLREGSAPLQRLLATDPDPEVRQMAAFALGLLQDPGATQALVAALGDPAPLVQGRAADALGRLGAAHAADALGRLVATYAPRAAAVAPDEVGAPLEPEIEAFRLGVYALARLKAFDPLAAAVLDRSGQPLVRWWPVAYALQQMPDRRARPALASFLRGPGIYGAAFAARALGALKDRTAVDLLLPLVDPARQHPFVVVSAVRALADLGDSRAGAPLRRLALAPTLPTAWRVEVIAALGVIGGAETTEVLLDLIADRRPALRAAALNALARSDPDTFVVVLSTRDPDPHWSVRAALAEALARGPSRVALPHLTALLSDPDQRVVPAVLRALVRVKAPEVGATLLERLRADDPVVRMTAARLVAELKLPGAPAALAAAYRQGLADPTYLARAAALDGLASLGLPPAVETLREALRDPEWAVRVRAATRLAALDPTTDYAEQIRPAPTRLVASDYEAAELVKPSVSPRAYLEFDRGVVEIELDVVNAPLTVANFVRLVGRGFYEGLPVHRVVPAFVVQMGDPRGDGEGGPGYTIRDELNETPFLRGTVGMALDWADTGGSQFFITTMPQPQLDGRYTAFGRVVAGMEVVDQLEPWELLRRVRVWDGRTMVGR